MSLNDNVSFDLSVSNPTDQDQTSVADAVHPSRYHLAELRWLAVLLPATAGIFTAWLLSGVYTSGHVTLLFCSLAFTGGLLSTWSPCGYSSLSLLRVDPPHDAAAIVHWLPTMVAHALGYVAGGLLLAIGLAAIGWLLPIQGFTSWALTTIAAVSILYGLHQLQIIRMPYPQLRVQVSHGARIGLPKWVTGFLYGGHLGLNFATYVRTPILYVVVLACVLSGSLLTTLAVVFSLNLGRFLPLLANLLPIPDQNVQQWMAKHDQGAVLTDAAALVFCGSFLLTSVLA